MSGSDVPKTLPSSRELWEIEVNERDLVGKTVHAAELASGSKIGYDQFLLLRVLWKTYETKISLPKEINKFLPEATKMLAHFRSWQTYCNSFSKPGNPEGSFAVARHYQILAADSEENTTPNSFDTPIALRTRAGRKGKFPNVSKLQLTSPKTPSKKPAKEPRTPDVLSEDDDDYITDDEDYLRPRITPAADVPEDLQRIMFPPTKDEQIVNAALVFFLNALTIHFPVSQNCNWTMHRKGFKADFTEASFEARTDGYLDDHHENAYALVEVKPVIRGPKESLIQMQESAQMVGWLMNDAKENAGDEVRVDDKVRLHVSQDRHEIFLTYAEYDDNYLAYLKEGKFNGAKPPFLTMHQYGPWNTQHSFPMVELGPILLAITLYASAKIEAKRKSYKR